MFNQSKRATLLFVISLLVAWGHTFSVQAEDLVKFSCGTIDKYDRFQSKIAMMVGVPTSVVCEIVGNSQKQLTEVLLMGKRQLGTELPVAAATNLTISEDTQYGELIFPPVFQSGEYQYTFSLVDTESRQPIAREVTVVEKIRDKERPRLEVVTLDKVSYKWMDEFTFAYVLDMPDGYLAEKNDLTLQVALADNQGRQCVLIDSDLQPRYASGSFTLRFPEAGQCTNTLVFSLTDVDRKILDEYRLAVPLVMSNVSSDEISTNLSTEKNSEINKKLVFGGVIFMLFTFIIIGLIRRNRK